MNRFKVFLIVSTLVLETSLQRFCFLKTVQEVHDGNLDGCSVRPRRGSKDSQPEVGLELRLVSQSSREALDSSPVQPEHFLRTGVNAIIVQENGTEEAVAGGEATAAPRAARL